MSTPLVVRAAAAGGLTLCLAIASPAAANAEVNIWKECGTRFQAAKAANELNGQSWQEFLKTCRLSAATQPALGETTTTPASVAASPDAARAAPTAIVASPPTPAISKSETASAPSAPTATPHPETASSQLAVEGADAEKLREQKCAAQWKAQKAQLKKTNPTLKWAQYWSECNKRLKVSTH